MSELARLCTLVNEKIPTEKITLETYISTENMLPNRGGITLAASLPNVDKVQAFRRGDVLVSNIRPYFKKIWQADKDGGCSNDVLVFRAADGVLADYLYYVLADNSFFDFATASAKGTKMPRGDKRVIMHYEVPNHSFLEQQKIAGILKCLDNKILANNKINDNLEQQAQAYFQKFFIDNQNPQWNKGTINDLGEVVGGGTPSKKKPEYYCANGIAWITPKDLSLTKAKFISHGETDISLLGFENSSAKLLPEGAVLFSSRAPIGYIAIATNEVTTNQGFKSVIPKKNIGTAFVYYFLKSNLSVIEGMASGSTFKEVSGSVMKKIPAIIPDQNTLTKFNESCNPILMQQKILQKQNHELEILRDSLIPKLISGQLD